MQCQDSIFQNGFLGGVQFKKSLKKWTFKQKSGGFNQENPQKRDFSQTWGSIQEWRCIEADTVYSLNDYSWLYKRL